MNTTTEINQLHCWGRGAPSGILYQKTISAITSILCIWVKSIHIAFYSLLFDCANEVKIAVVWKRKTVGGGNIDQSLLYYNR